MRHVILFLKQLPFALFWVLLLLCLLFTSALALIPNQNDSSWYYMLVHFVQTGEYLHESKYPSFDRPSQLYPFLGYPLFLYLSEKLAALTSLAWYEIVKWGQFFLFTGSALLTVGIVRKLSNKSALSYLAGCLYILYFPYFNFTNLLMSEIYAQFFLLLTLYLFLGWQTKPSWRKALPLLLLCGYIVLIKPVFAVVVLLILFLFVSQIIRTKKWSMLLLILMIGVLPLSQSIFNQQYYGNYSLRKGLGWNLWNRVIQHDQLIPYKTVGLKRLKKCYVGTNKKVTYSYWWDLSRDLSELGYKEAQIQLLCKDVAVAGIRKYPFKYLGNTCLNSWEISTAILGQRDVYKDWNAYAERTAGFALEPSHQPLNQKLKGQFSGNKVHNDRILQINKQWADLADWYTQVVHHWSLWLLFLLFFIWRSYTFLRSGLKQGQGMWLVSASCIGVILASNLAEYPQTRLILPAVILFICSLLLEIEKSYTSACRFIKVKRQAHSAKRSVKA